MSSGCGDVLTLEDLRIAKQHQLFEAEVITGKLGGVASGANIDYATNQATGQTQKTMPAILRDAGFRPASWDFSTGGILGTGDRDKVVFDPVSKTWYSFIGTLPVTVPAGFNPVGNANWKPQTDPDLRTDLTSETGYSVIGEISSISNLRAINTARLTSGSRVSVRSYYNGGVYGGGFFRWDAASSEADDGGYVINPAGNTGAGRWKREFNSAFAVRTVSPLEFGAKLNDSTFDSAPAINAAISYLNPYTDRSFDNKTGGDVIIPAGKYYINDTIYAAPNVRLIGTGGIPGFRNTRDGCTSIYAMSTMDLTKVMYDTAPWLNDGTSRYKKTTEMLYGRTESDGYYGAYLENLCFIGQADTQAAVRVWRVPRSQINNIAVYNCKVAFWINGSWEVTIRNCYNYGAKYACILIYQCTAINVYAGYFTSNTSFPWSGATQQWFHRGITDSNKPNIAFTTTGVYAYNSFDVNFHGGTFEGNNRDFALYYCQNVNFFGAYTEHLGPADTETGHRVFVQAAASVVNFFGTYMNHANKDLVIQSGNTLDSNGVYAKSERSMVNIVNPKVEYGFNNILKDLGYGSANIRIESYHPVTIDLAVTLQAQRQYTAQFVGLLDQYTMRIPSFSQGQNTFTTTINNVINGGEYSIRLLMTNVGQTAQQDLRFNVLVGGTCSVSGYQGRSRFGTAILPAPTASFNATTGTLTLTFTGNSDIYSLNRIKCVPVENQPLFSY